MAMCLHIKLSRKIKDQLLIGNFHSSELLCCMKTIIHLYSYPEENEYY